MVEPSFGYLQDGICCITHITKLLGPLKEWEERLRVSHKAAYNMIHFTPIQQLGGSGSAYCISDQLSLPADYRPQNTNITYTGMENINIYIYNYHCTIIHVNSKKE